MSDRLTEIFIQLRWDENAPGWAAHAWPTDPALDDANPRWSGTAISGFSPLPAIRNAIEGVSRTLNIHPDNTTILISAEGDDLLEAHRRSMR